ncbi:hypothetical protein ACHAWF_018384 [Thalassiosira exigua]
MSSNGSGGVGGGSMRDLASSLKAKASSSSLFGGGEWSSASGSGSGSILGGLSASLRRSRGSAAAADDGPPPLPLPDVARPFPVVEQPPRIVLTSLLSPHDVGSSVSSPHSKWAERRRLTSARRGAVRTTTSRGDAEQFLLIPAEDDAPEAAAERSEEGAARGGDGPGAGESDSSMDAESSADSAPSRSGLEQGAKRRKGGRQEVFHLRSYKHGRYLSADSTGGVSTVDLSGKDDKGRPITRAPGKSERWALTRSPGGGHSLVSERSGLCLSHRPNEEESIGLSNACENSESWEVEFVSGELCFISSSPSSSLSSSSSTSPDKSGQRIRCDLMGSLTLTKDKRGWEVWRFVEMGGGALRIVSWMHSQFCLACTHKGAVQTAGIGEVDEGCDLWTVEKAPEGYCGVVIKSAACARRMLCRGEQGLYATQELEGEAGVWQLDAAHSQTYALMSLRHGRSIGPFPYVTDNAKQSDQWILQQIGDGTVRLYLKSSGQYLRSYMMGEAVCDSTPPNDADTSDLWRMEQRSDGGYTFASKGHGGLLAFSDAADGTSPLLCTVPSPAEDGREVWCVNPVLPRAISSGKIKTFALGTSIAVGTTVAMPFLMAGMLAVVPAEATLAASILGAGLTSAEAIASVGAIGVTAAIVFREASDTLGIESEREDDEDEKNYTKRPLCSWKSW